MNIKNRKRFNVSCFFALIAILFLLSAQIQASSKYTSIYYFFPDSPSSNLSLLKGRVEALFSETALSIDFQPFARLSDLNQQMQKQPPDFLISPPWYATKDKKLKVLLKSYRKDSSNYSKLLISHASNNMNDLSFVGKSLAVTVMGYEASSAVDVFEYEKLKSFNAENIIEVVKDIDAIFAVALKQVDMAIVSQSTVDKLRKINPRIIAAIQVVAVSKPLSMPVLLHRETDRFQEKTVELTRFMKKLKKNNVFEELLLIDEWRIGR